MTKDLGVNLGWEQLKKNGCSPNRKVFIKYCSNDRCSDCQEKIPEQKRNFFEYYFFELNYNDCPTA